MSSGSPETRGAILESALSLFEEGDTEPTMQDIADRAGVSRQALYLHFENRTDLLVELVAWTDAEKYDIVSFFEPVEAVTDPVERLRSFVDASLRYQPFIATVAKALMHAASGGDEAAGAAYEDRMRSRRKACRDIVRRLERAGQLAPGLNANTAADLLWAVIGLPLWFDLVDGRGWSADRIRRELGVLAERALTGS